MDESSRKGNKVLILLGLLVVVLVWGGGRFLSQGSAVGRSDREGGPGPELSAAAGQPAQKVASGSAPLQDQPRTRRASAGRSKRLLKPSDFEYVGSFAPPLHPTGRWQDGDTAFSLSGLALRKVNGELHFFHAANPDGNVLYEMVFPGLAVSDETAQAWPRAKVLRTWKNWNKKLSRGNAQLWQEGLFWDDERGVLWWNYGNSYNVSGQNDPCFGFTELKDSGPVIHGPWRVEGGGANSHKCQGGMTRIPDWFAAKYTQGKNLGLGFGGTWSGQASASNGPSLFAALAPKPGSSAVGCQALLDFPNGHFCVRDPDYKTFIPWNKPPKDGVGFWAEPDKIYGGGIWIDLPDVQGLVFFPHLGHGDIRYLPGGAVWGGATSNIFIFDPADLAQVAEGKRWPWNVKPAHQARFPYVGYQDGPQAQGKGEAARAVYTRGCCLDPESRTLYVLVSSSYHPANTMANFPLVHGFKIHEEQ